MIKKLIDLMWTKDGTAGTLDCTLNRKARLETIFIDLNFMLCSILFED